MNGNETEKKEPKSKVIVLPTTLRIEQVIRDIGQDSVAVGVLGPENEEQCFLKVNGFLAIHPKDVAVLNPRDEYEVSLRKIVRRNRKKEEGAETTPKRDAGTAEGTAL